MPAEFHFLRPEWLLALPIVAALAVFFAYRRLGPGNWARVVDRALAPHVLAGSSGSRRDGRWLLFGLTGVLVVLALAGPAWERIAQPVFRSDQSMVVALDLSRSMDAQDVQPSRLMRARLKILDLLERRASGQTALVVYSANAFTVTPLTTDTDTVAALVNSLSTDIMPSRGSYPAAAIAKGRQLLEQAAVGSGEILLITDGGASPAANRVAEDLYAAGYSLSVLGVGTPQGAPIPRAGGGFVSDSAGQMAIPRLEEEGLRALAAAGGGRYARLGPDGGDLDYLLSGEVAARAAGDDAQTTDQWQEEGPWLLLLALPLAALAFRRGWAFVVVLAVMPLAKPAQASLWEDLWFNSNQQAERRLEAGDAAAAASLFEDEEWQAVSRYRAGDYAESAARFAEREDARNLYNLGNALARQGEFESAIEAYDQVLELAPDDPDAAYNRDLLRQALEQQQQQQQQEQGEQQESSQSSGDDSQQSQETTDPNQESDGQSQSDSEQDDGEAATRPEDEAAEQAMRELEEELRRAAEEAEQQPGQELSEEQLAELRQQQAEQQAMEQWLRRIPNDPGGLLRRKFRYQYQREGRDQDGNSLWPDNEEQPW